jgi:hypothetical protein
MTLSQRRGGAGVAPFLKHSSVVLLRLNIFGWVIRGGMQQAAVRTGYGEVARPHCSTERLSCALLVTAGLQSQAE